MRKKITCLFILLIAIALIITCCTLFKHHDGNNTQATIPTGSETEPVESESSDSTDSPTESTEASSDPVESTGAEQNSDIHPGGSNDNYTDDSNQPTDSGSESVPDQTEDSSEPENSDSSTESTGVDEGVGGENDLPIM